METRKHLSFLKHAKEQLLENDTLRFLLFIEKTPKHRVTESINIMFLAFLGFGCYLAGLAGFIVWERYTIFGFLLYDFSILVAVLETLHCLFDR